MDPATLITLASVFGSNILGNTLFRDNSAERLLALAQKCETHSQPSVEQLSTSVWGGNELSLEPQGTETRLIYQVRIVAQGRRR